MIQNRITGAAALLASSLLLSACVSSAPEDSPSPFLSELPEGLAETAGPNQDLSRVRIMPADGCYWYEHQNPVETTFLPLRTNDGRPICARAQ
ncbi:hypothetical protein [Pararhodobacter sp. CCB-MM2]|uniref:hypothetical protein n=1 Tax=Pararhodobacter sp. CCB-MM2 TaxID=1786003 RepID=UPI00082BBE82|nr:hypothetical protein [Pararhodobacter sp. CCB-MM2]MCA2010510.1 hypothetical protein [Cereibacter sphaeroides]